MNKLGYIAVPYLFLMFLAYAIVKGVRAAIKRARGTHERGQSLLEVCLVLAVVLILSTVAYHMGMQIREALHDAFEVFHH